MKSDKLKDFGKAFLIAIGVLLSPIILILLLLCIVWIYSTLFVHHEYKFRIGIDNEWECYDALVLTRGDTVIMYPKNQWTICETEGKFFHYYDKDDSNETKFIRAGGNWDIGEMVVSGYIADYDEDNEFMIADQKPLDSILGKYEEFYDENGNFLISLRPNDQHNSLLNDKFLEDSPIHQFWIIALRTADVYGPLSYEEYKQKRTELGVSQDLMLKYEKSLDN